MRLVFWVFACWTLIRHFFAGGLASCLRFGVLASLWYSRLCSASTRHFGHRWATRDAVVNSVPQSLQRTVRGSDHCGVKLFFGGQPCRFSAASSSASGSGERPLSPLLSQPFRQFGLDSSQESYSPMPIIGPSRSWCGPQDVACSDPGDRRS